MAKMTEVEIGGIYQMKELRYGNYFVREKRTAPRGLHVLRWQGLYPVSIEENGKTYAVENEAGKGFYERRTDWLS